MAIPFLSDIRLPSAGKVYLWTGHNDNFLKYDLWQASASAGMTIKNIANSGSIILQPNSTTALTLDSSQNVIAADAFTGKLQGAVTGAPDQTIWRVSGQYTNWGIFYNEGSPDKIEFKAGGTVTSTIALDNGDATFNNVHSSGRVRIQGGTDNGSQLNLFCDSDGDAHLAAYTFAINTGSNSSRTESLKIDNNKNATFAGDINLGTGKSIYLNGSTNGLRLLHDGSNGLIINESTGDLKIQNSATDKDIIFRGKDGASTINALRLDMSDAGWAHFNTGIAVGNTAATSTFAGDVRINGSHLVLANGTTEAQSTDYLYIGGTGLNEADAAIYIGNGGSGDNVGWRLYYEGSGSGNDNKFIIKSENQNSPVDALAFTQDGNATFAGDITISNATPALNLTDTDNSTNIALSSVGGALIVNSPSDQVYQYGGTEKFRISTSTHTSAAHVVPGADSTYNLGSNSVRWANVYADTLHGTVALSSEASNLGAFDDRDMAPEDMSYSDDLKLFFVEKSGIEGGTVGSNWQDALFISSYGDSSGGNPNLLTFDKSEKKIYHYQASATATSWGTPKELAYTSDFVKRTGGSSTSMSGDLHIIAGAPRIVLQDSTDDDDHQIVFRSNVGGDDYKITTKDFTSAGTGDGLFIGSETSDPVKLITNDTIALAIDSSQHVSLPGAYLTLKDINSHAQIEASSSSLMLKAVNIQAQGNFIPDGNGNRSLGASNRYWSETYTNGVTSGGNIVINSNTPVLTLGVINSSTGNAKIQLYSKNSGTSNGFAIQYNKDTNIDRLEFIDGGGTAAFQFHNGGNAEFEGTLTTSQINTGQGATEVHLMNQNVRTSDNVQFADLTLTGNLNLYGDINTQNVTNLDVNDKVITVGKGQNEASSGGSGLLVDGSSASILWDESNDTWDFNKGINVAGHVELDGNKAVIFDNTNNNNAWYIRNGGSNSATLQFGLGANPGANIKHTFAGDGSVSFATYVNAATGFRMASGQAIDFIDSNIGYNSIERNTSVGGLQINTGDTASMNILDNGNVGINSTSPEEKLTIATGNVQFRKTAQAANTSLGFLGWKNTYATGTHVAAKIDVLTRNESSNAHDYTNLVFYTWNGYNSLSEKMRIADDGNVGIGYDNPYKKLHLHNPADSGTPDCQMNFTTGVTEAGDGNGFRVGWNGTVANMYLFENADMRFATNNSERMRIKADGKVGIGTTTPDKKLEVSGDIKISGGDYNGLYFENAGGTTKSLLYQHANYNALVIKDTVNNADRFIFTNSGKLGIGVTSPTAPLHIATSGATNTLKLYQATYQQFEFKYDDTYHSTMMFGHFGELQYDGNGGYLRISNNSTQSGSHIALRTANSERMRVTHDGKIGIGTTSPSRALHVAGAGGSSGGIMIAPTSGDAEIQFQDSGVTNAYITLDDGTQDLNFRDDSATVMTIDFGSERVGIGTTSPDYALDVAGVIKGTSSIRVDAGSPYFGLYNSGTEKAYLQWSQSNSRLTLQSDGDIEIKPGVNNVGIGTTSPTYKLSVVGAISGSGFVTYTKSYGSLNATGNAVAGITASANGNGSSCGFTFTCFGGTGKYQKVVYSCYNDQGTWRARKVIDEGTNDLDVTASADGSTITFTFKATSSSQSYTPRVKVEAEGHNINSTYA